MIFKKFRRVAKYVVPFLAWVALNNAVLLAQPFGLSQRVPVSGLQFPLDDPNVSTVSRAFPNIALNNQPLYVIAAPDGTNRLFIVEKLGTIRVVTNDDSVTTSNLFLDLSSISGKIVTGGEQGLLGLAFDPDYATNGFFYVHYSAGSGAARSVIARYKVSGNPNVADVSSEKIIIEIPQPGYSNHKGGMLAFGPDKMLYIGLGDGGSGNDPLDTGQNCADMLGNILRIDPRPAAGVAAPYVIPSDNPYALNGNFACGMLTSAPSRRCGIDGYQAGQICKELYAYGIRNPWRFSFDRSAGTLWLGDVGQDLYEEIDIVRAGDNLGWRVFEGRHSKDSSTVRPAGAVYRAPILEYGHTSIDPAGGNSVTGGYVYRGKLLPALYGKYIYGDYSSGSIWALQYDGTSVVSNQKIASVSSLVSFGEDKDGELYAVSIGGQIYRFKPTPASTGSIPALLSQTGIFSNLGSLQVNTGAVEYDVNAPLWSDGAAKRRWVLLPGTSQITFSATGAYVFPVGTAIVKHFELALSNTQNRRLETRVFFRHNQGWSGYTYKWRSNGTDADLLTDSVTESYQVQDAAAPGGVRTQNWYYPSRVDCLACHTFSAGRILGVRTQQLNRNFVYPAASDNQLRAWNHIGLFSADIGATSAYDAYPQYGDVSKPLENRARAYLASNCAHCHQPGEPHTGVFDLRYDTVKSAMNSIGIAPLYGDLGIANAKRIKNGAKEQSIVWERMRRLDTNRMPQLATTIVDSAGVTLVGAWIDSLGGSPAAPNAPSNLKVLP